MKSLAKRIASAMSMLLFFCLFPSPARAAGQAAELTGTCTAASRAGADTSALFDRNRTTRLQTAPNDLLTLRFDSPVSALYLIWDRPPGRWSLKDGREILIGGRYGFIHELAPVAPARELTLLMPEQPAALCDIYAFGEGDLPDWVQSWRPPHEKADLLLLPTHADDEWLFFGGSIPYYAVHRKMKVQVAYLTNHWAEPYRPHELLDGLWTAGLRNYPVISEFVDMYADSLDAARALYSQEAFTAHITGLLRRFKPLVAVGHDLEGEYGHGVHMLGAHSLLEAADLSGNPGYCPESAESYGLWTPQKVYLHLYPQNPIVMDWDVQLPALGKTAFEAASEGYAKHVSQHQWFQMERWGPYDCRKFGLARTQVGADVNKDDFFENIQLS